MNGLKMGPFRMNNEDGCILVSIHNLFPASHSPNTFPQQLIPQLIKVEIVSTELESDVNFGFKYVIARLI